MITYIVIALIFLIFLSVVEMRLLNEDFSVTSFLYSLAIAALWPIFLVYVLYLAFKIKLK